MIAFKGPVVASVGDSGFTCPLGLLMPAKANVRRLSVFRLKGSHVDRF
jgi:hypothetical protein